VTWLARRQHGAQLGASVALLGAVAVSLLATGVRMHARFSSSGLASCVPQSPTPECQQLAYSFRAEFPLAFQVALMAAVGLLPLLAGVFLGVPLVAADTGRGLQRLAWTQSVGRTKWLVVKLAVVGIPMLVATAVLEALLSWWLVPLSAAYGGLDVFSPVFFDLSGFVPVAYVACALAAGVAAGAVLGRVVPALALTTVGLVALRAAAFFVRPRYLPPLTASYPTSYQQTPAAVAGGYEVSERIVDAAGRLVSDHHGFSFPNPVLAADCPNLAASFTSQQIAACASRAGLRFVVEYQPAERYWLFQGIEAAAFVVLAAALVGLTLWWLRHRVK
jgi:hypothetical protein